MINNERSHYDADIMTWIIEQLPVARDRAFMGPQMLKGRRFFDNAYILATVESSTPQADFVKWPLSSLGKAIEEAASADYWYTYEKEYGGNDEC